MKHIVEQTLLESANVSAPVTIGFGADDTTVEDRFLWLRGRSPVMRELYHVLQRVAPTEATVLLQGESGTGKELIARTLHDLSSRREGPFVPVNCGALSANLAESELFGHERGSFTGANRQHRGYFERSMGGTLFLDEITEMPTELQVHLLRVLETGKLVRVGGDQEIAIDVRVIAATNRKTEDAVTGGRLREDLFFRLAAFPVCVPALRERTGDIVLLAQYFLDRLNVENHTRKTLGDEVRTALERHSWPGNVRELKNAVHRAYILSDVAIETQHFPPWQDHPIDAEGGSIRFTVGSSIDEVERRLIYATLRHFRGNKRLAAATLRVSLKTLYNRLKRYQEEGRPGAT